MSRGALRVLPSCAVVACLCLLSSPCAAQTWMRAVAVGTYANAKSVAAVPAGGHVVAGSAYGPDGTMDGLLLRLDAAGNLLWTKTYTTGASGAQESFSCVQVTGDGGFVAVGKSVTSAGDPGAAWLVKTDASGALSWQRLYGEYDGAGYDDDSFQSVSPTSDGGYIVAGETSSFGTSNTGIYLMKLDASGNIAWQRKDIPGSSDRAGVAFTAQRSDGDFVTGGWSGNGSSLWSVYALVSSRGTSSPPYYPPGYTVGSFVTGLNGYSTLEASGGVKMTDGSLVVVGTGTTPSYAYRGIVCGLNASGQLAWSRDFLTDPYYSQFLGVTEAPAGGVLAVGAGPPVFSMYDGWAVRLDASGSVLWQKAYGGTGDDYLAAAAPDGSGGFLMVGWTRSFGTSDYRVLLVHCDANGDVAAPCPSASTLSSGSTAPGGASYDYGSGAFNVSSTNTSYSGSSAAPTATTTEVCPFVCAAPSGLPAVTAADVAPCLATGVKVTWSWSVGAWGDLGSGTRTLQVLRDGEPVASGACSGSIPPGTTTCTDLTGTPSQSYEYSVRYTNGCGTHADATPAAAADQADPPSAIASMVSQVVCLGRAHYFSATASCGRPPYTYAWDFQDDGSWDSAEPNPSFTYGVEGTYPWRFRLTDALAGVYETTGTATASTASPPCCVLDAYEPDDTASSSVAGLEGGAVQTRNFCDDAEDWVRVSACASRPFLFRTLDLAAGTDTVLELYGPDGTTLLASDDDGGGGLASRIQWVAPADGTYHLRVRQKDGSTAQSFTYRLTCEGDTTPCRTWGVALHVDGAEYGRAVVPLPDGGLLTAGYAYASSRYREWLQRFAGDGSLLWQSRLSHGSYQLQATAGTMTADGGVALLARSSANSWDLVVLKVTSEGNLVWQKSYGGTKSEEGASIVSTADGGFLVIGTSSSLLGTEYGSTGWLLRLDANGNPLWQRAIGCSGCSTSGTGVAETASGDIWASGYLYSGAAGTYVGWLAQFDPGGTVKWSTRFDISADSLVIAGNLSCDAAGNLFVLAGQNGGYEVMKLLADRSVAWVRRFASVTLLDLQPLPDGGLLLGGQLPAGFGLLRTTSAGDLSWARTYTALGGGYVYDVAALPDGGFALTGDWTGPAAGQNHIATWKVAADGTVGAACALVASPSVTVTAPTATLSACPASAFPVSLTPADLSLTVASATESPISLCSWTAPAPGPGEVSPPCAVTPLAFSGPDTLVWEDKGWNGATAFNLYRGTLEGLPSGDYGSCAQSGLTESQAIVRDAPLPPGQGITYLVTGVNAQGEGILGHNSAGQVEPNLSPCP